MLFSGKIYKYSAYVKMSTRVKLNINLSCFLSGFFS